MSKTNKLVVEGKVSQAMPDTSFLVTMGNGQQVLAYLSGRLYINHIKILPGDTVLVELSPYDLTRGRVTQRL